MKAESMDVLKHSLSVLSSENEGLSDSHPGLIKAFNNLDLNDDQRLLHVKSEEIEKTQCLLPLNCSLESGKDCVVSNGHKSVDEGDVKSKSSIPVHVKNNVVELVEIHKTTSPVKRDESVVSNKESSGKMNYIKSEEDLSAFFLELCLDKKSSCNVKCSATETYSNEVSQDKLSKSLLSEKIPGTMTSCVNSALLKKRENVKSSRQDKHTPGKVLDEKVCGLTTPDVNGVFLTKEDAVDSFSKKDAANFTSKKMEASSENELPVSDNDGLDCDLVERGSTKKDPNGERKEKKIMSGRAQKVTENASKHLKSFPKLHMSGGLIVDASQCKTLNATSGYLNLVPFNDSSGDCSNLVEFNMQASSLPPFFDPNPINPVIQGSHIDNSYLFPPSCESDNFLDVFSIPNSVLSSSSNNSSISSVEVQNQSTVAVEGQNQKNTNSHQHFFDHIEDVLNYPSPVSEMSSYPGQSSRSTSPESGYCSSPRLSPFSDDSSEQCKYKDRQPSISSTSLEICSPPPCVPSGEEFIDNWDMSIFDDIDSISHEIRPTDEESEKIINVIKQDLKKCEELCKANDSDMVKNEHDTLSIPVNSPDSQNSQNLCTNVNSSLQGCSMQTHAPHQQQSSLVNIATQVPSAQANTPQVLVIYVPYAVNGTDKGSKPFKPIEPDPEGQRLLARSPRECLKEKLDRKKQMHYLYRITEKLQSSDKNVIYIENAETRRTNLHLAVIKQDVELAYTILEVHKKCSGDLSMVNCRDIYKKTALQYAIRNVMTVFVEYLKDYGAK